MQEGNDPSIIVSRPKRLCKWPSRRGIDPAPMHRAAVIAAGTLDRRPHNGALVTLLAV
jgi:hypothetical protein